MRLKEKTAFFSSNEFFRNPIFQWVFIASLAVNFINWGALAFFIRPVDFPLILHYNVFFGVDIIGAWWQVFFLPGMGLFILAVNTFLAFLLFARKERIAAYIFLLASFFVQAGLAISSASLILINY